MAENEETRTGEERSGGQGEDWLRYGLAFEASEEGLWDWDLIAQRVWRSRRWRTVTGVGGEGVQPEAWMERVHPEDRGRLREELGELGAGRMETIRNEHRVCDERGRWRWVMLRGLVARDNEGRVTHVAGSLTDTTDCRMTDALTGMPNRAFFAEHVERRIERGFRHGDWNFAVAAAALDRFERMNETLGSGAGHWLMAEMARRLERVLPGASIAARVMGAEFLVCLELTGGDGEAMRLAREIAEAMREPFVWQGHTAKPRPAVGVVRASAWYAHPEELMADAEAALMQARRRAPPGVVRYSEGMREEALERLELEGELERAIREGELVMFYQPEVDLRTGRTIGFEALVRWRHARRGLLLPGEFIPVAEQTGLIVPLGEWGLEEACRQLMEWRRTGNAELEGARMSVNLSARQLVLPDLARRVERVLEDTGLAPEHLRLEVTESGLIADAEAGERTMRNLEQLGVGLHMDDFGTGYSSLEYLQRFPFDTLKIDRTFVEGVARDHESRTIVSTILELSRSLGMDVVAEGIENAEQLAALRGMGCPCGQGYYFARPMEAKAVEAMAERRMGRLWEAAVGEA